ncbi:MAG: hypothetical protein K2M76_01665, partial [Muribaculaceae bacterium]|nr:hypothetical protein [Muribaculaceae bacterium]
MKRLYNFIKSHAYIACAATTIATCACSDNEPDLELRFGIEDELSGLHVGAEGVATNATKHGMSIDDALTITIRANSSWQIKPVTDDTDWVIMLPMEGDKDGIVRIG